MKTNIDLSDLTQILTSESLGENYLKAKEMEINQSYVIFFVIIAVVIFGLILNYKMNKR